MATFYGSSTIIEGGYRETGNKYTGIVSSYVYKGTQAQIEAKRDYYMTLGARYDIEQTEGGVWVLTVDMPGDEPEYSWEIMTEARGIDILNADAFVDITPTNRAMITNWFDGETYDTGSGTIKDLPEFSGDATQIALCQTACGWKLMGITEMTDFIPVLKSSYIVEREYEIYDANSHVNEVHTVDTMIGVELIPPRLWDSLNNDYSVSVTDTEFPGGAKTFKFNYGWLKGPPQITQMGALKVQVVQEYRFAAYPEDIYGPMI